MPPFIRLHALSQLDCSQSTDVCRCGPEQEESHKSQKCKICGSDPADSHIIHGTMKNTSRRCFQCYPRRRLPLFSLLLTIDPYCHSKEVPHLWQNRPQQRSQTACFDQLVVLLCSHESKALARHTTDRETFYFLAVPRSHKHHKDEVSTSHCRCLSVSRKNLCRGVSIVRFEGAQRRKSSLSRRGRSLLHRRILPWPRPRFLRRWRPW